MQKAPQLELIVVPGQQSTSELPTRSDFFCLSS